MTNDNNPNDAPGLGGAGAELDLGPIRARLEKATPGPWEWRQTEIGELVSMAEGLGTRNNKVCAFGNVWDDYVIPSFEPTDEDAELIANAPTDLAALVAEVERLRREVNTMAKSSYDQIIDKRWSWDREFEPPYPDVWDGK